MSSPTLVESLMQTNGDGEPLYPPYEVARALPLLFLITGGNPKSAGDNMMFLFGQVGEAAGVLPSDAPQVIFEKLGAYYHEHPVLPSVAKAIFAWAQQTTRDRGASDISIEVRNLLGQPRFSAMVQDGGPKDGALKASPLLRFTANKSPLSSTKK
jgi:hypothetical protein